MWLSLCQKFFSDIHRDRHGNFFADCQKFPDNRMLYRCKSRVTIKYDCTATQFP